MDHKAYMYVLECRDGSYYTGYTTDVKRRLAVHNSGKGAKYTRARLPVKLIYAQGFASKEEAMSAEALLKRKKRPQKERFLSENQDRNLLSYFEAWRGVLCLLLLLSKSEKNATIKRINKMRYYHV